MTAISKAVLIVPLTKGHSTGWPFSLAENPYIRSMSKTTRLLARIVGAFFYTLAVVIFTAKGSFEVGREEMEGKQDGQN